MSTTTTRSTTMNDSGIIRTDVLRAKDQHAAHRYDAGLSGIHLNVVTAGKVSVQAFPSHCWITVQGDGELTQIMLPITREQLCDLACGLWTEEMAEADQ
jgi:hypothetical protein